MAHLGFTVDSSQALSADGNFRKLISTTAAAEQAAKRLGAANDTLGTGYDRLKQKGEAALATLKRIDQMTGVNGGLRRAAADIEAYGAELDRLRAKYNPIFAASKQYETELNELNRAHQVGAINANEHASALAALDARYASATQAANVFHAATSRSSVQGTAHTTNLMFQAQDIAMMTAMGQNPMMLAMQQGSQVGPILQQMGGGKAAIAGIGTALASLVSPINLITLGVIGFGAAGVQSLMGMLNQTDKATEALERHEKWLDAILAGYDDIRESAQQAADEALRLPSESVALELGGDRQKKADQLKQELEDIYTMPIRMAAQAQPALAAQIDQIQTLIDSLKAGDTTLRDFGTELRQVKFSEEPGARVKGLVDQLLSAANAALSLQSQLEGVTAAVNAMSVDSIISQSFAQLNGASEAIQALKAMTPDLRTPAERAQALYDANSGSDVSGDMKRQLDYTLAQIDAQKKAQDALKATKSAGNGLNQWDTATDSFQQRIEQQRLENELVGQSTYEIERQRAAFDLLAQAKQANVPITSDLTDKINTMSAEYATLAVQMEAIQRQADLAISINNTLANGFANMFTGIVTGSQTAEEAIANLLGQLGQLLINQAFMSLFGAGTTGGAGGFLAGIFSPRSFDGGGDTGSGPRIGGLDGKGGFMAMVHPQETIIDRTRTATQSWPAANQNAANNNFNMYATIHANSEQEGAAAARGWQAEMERWKRSGEGHAFVRKVVGNSGRVN